VLEAVPESGLLEFFLKYHHTPPRIKARTAMPPMTAPTMAPIGVDFFVGLLEEFGDDPPLSDDGWLLDDEDGVGVDNPVAPVLLVVTGVIVRANIFSRLLLLNPPTGPVAVAPPVPLQHKCVSHSTHLHHGTSHYVALERKQKRKDF
jgi:hypothetical protein